MAWWDLLQLMDQMEHAINIIEHLHPNKVTIWLFDCSSTHKALAKDALNVNNMGVRPGRKQSHLQDHHPTLQPSSETWSP